MKKEIKIGIVAVSVAIAVMLLAIIILDGLEAPVNEYNAAIEVTIHNATSQTRQYRMTASADGNAGVCDPHDIHSAVEAGEVIYRTINVCWHDYDSDGMWIDIEVQLTSDDFWTQTVSAVDGQTASISFTIN